MVRSQSEGIVRDEPDMDRRRAPAPVYNYTIVVLRRYEDRYATYARRAHRDSAVAEAQRVARMDGMVRVLVIRRTGVCVWDSWALEGGAQ